MIDCPTKGCGARLADNAVICNDCGRDPRQLPAVGKPKIPHDPMRHYCSHVWLGQRCAEMGALSEGTKGEGPWYCHRHFPLFSGRYGGPKPTSPPVGFTPLKALLLKAKPDPAGDAERLAIQQEMA